MASVIVTVTACMVLVYLLHVGSAYPAAAAKLVASSGFLLAAITAGALSHRAGRIVFAGLIGSMLGDMALIGQSERHFLFGLTAFLLAHIAYITAFIVMGQDRGRVLAAAVPVLICAAAVLYWLMPYAAGDIAMPVRVYTAVISLMVITAFGAWGAGAPALIAVGAVLFLVSDLSVAALRIAGTDMPTYILGLPMYYAGQLCIGLGAAQSSSQ